MVAWVECLPIARWLIGIVASANALVVSPKRQAARWQGLTAFLCVLPSCRNVSRVTSLIYTFGLVESFNSNIGNW